MMTPQVNSFFLNLKKWREELEVLRTILVSFHFEEVLKWNSPCYMINGKNVLIIQGFKEYFGIMFFKGALLNDPNHVLSQPGEVQAGRQIRLKNMEEIIEKETIIRAYIEEAIALEKNGAKVEMKKTEDFTLPNELIEALTKNPALELAFNKLTPGRQKAYSLFIAEAKQSKTRIDRIEKNIARILNGKGLNDCICGLSKRMPNCDGSHKQLVSF